MARLYGFGGSKRLFAELLKILENQEATGLSGSPGALAMVGRANWQLSWPSVDRITFTYDAVGNQLTAANGAGVYTFTYNDLNQVHTVAEPFGVSLTFTYDALGRRTLVEDSFGGVLTSVYDVLNRLESRKFGGTSQTPLRVDLTYTVESQQESFTRYSDLSGTTKVATTSFTYDAAQRLSNLHHFDGSNNNIANYTYTYDAHSRLTNINRNGTPVTYTYDNTDQVTADGTNTFTYDAEGNRTNEGYSTGTGNQLTSDGTGTYTYDDEGNQTKKSKGTEQETWTYAYDHRNQLTWVEKRATDSGTLQQKVQFQYDAFGNRIEKTVDSDGDGNVDTTQRYSLDGWNPAKPSPLGNENWDVLFDLDESNDLETRYIRADVVDQLFARIAANGDAYWYLGDHLGSIRDITDNTGAVKDTLSYDAFGNITAETDPNYRGRYAWTGREYDTEIDLQYNRARYYDPKTGRWLSQDPLGFRAGDSNLYRYVNNRPTVITDPSGLQQPQTFDGGTTGFANLEKFVGQLQMRYGPLKVGVFGPNSKALTIDAKELAAAVLKANKGKFVQPLMNFAEGLDVKLVATFDNDKMARCHFWNQKVKIESTGIKTDDLPQIPQFQNDGGALFYPNQELKGKTITLYDTPGHGNAILWPMNLFDFNKKTMKITISPVDQKTYDKLVNDNWEQEGKNKTKIKFSFIDHLMYVDTDAKKVISKGSWAWGFTIDYNNKEAGEYKPSVTIQIPVWKKN